MQQQGGQAQGQAQPRRGLPWTSILTQLLIFWVISNILFRKNDTTEDPYVKTVTETDLNNAEAPEEIATENKEAGKIPCLFHSEQELSLQLFLSETQNFPFNVQPLYEKYPFTLRSASKYQLDLNITTTEHMRNNGSMYFHIVLAEKEFFATFPAPNKNFVFSHTIHPMNVFKLQDKFVQRQNLITGELVTPDLTKENLNEERKIISFWKPSITISVVDVFYPLKPNAIPEQIRKHVVKHPSGKAYYPLLYINEFWLLDENLIPVNETVDTVPLTIYFDPLSLTWFSIYQQFDDSFKMQESIGSTKREIDEVKLMFLDTNPYFLALTVAVSLLHTIFDFLAFKNDITFWKNKKDLKGLSIKSIFWNIFSQVIVFFYLLDNDTSFLILLSSGIGIAIEAWKVTKAVNVSVQHVNGFPMLKFEDKESYVSETKEYDDLAFKWLGRLLFPLVIGYSIYSLYYDTHKSWYSWVLASLTGCVYTFGFIMMTPQLFINYKLKSVAHLPWRTFTYKALNTFIDDMFAFIIRMPTLHRLSCFRDDIIFFIFLYQKYIYPVDKTRVNEFGASGMDYENESPKENIAQAKDKKEQ